MGQAIVDAAAVLGFDPFDPTFRADPYRGYPQPGQLVQTDAGLWVTSSYALCEHALRDPSFGHGLGDEGETWRQGPRQRSFLTMDPPDHTRLRRLVSKAFTPRLVERLRPRVTALVDELLDAAAGSRTDLISALAYPLPVIVISELLGVPAADRDRFKDWSEALARGLDPDFLLPDAEIVRREAARREFNAYFRALAAERRAAPRDDLLSALVAVSDDGDALTEAELLATCVLLLVAGHETTVNLIGNGALALLRNPEQLALFRSHPDAVPAAVEELLRYDPPVQFTLRTAVVDTELGGTPLAKGSFVLLLNGMANRDPSVFTEPDRLDVTRYAGGSAARHLSFGQGIHYCLGAPLARLEGQVALSKLFARNVTMAAEPVTYRHNLVLRGLESLHVDLST